MVNREKERERGGTEGDGATRGIASRLAVGANTQPSGEG